MLERAELYSVARLYQPEQRPVYDGKGRVVGWQRAITARPTAEVREQSGYVPDSDTLQRYAHVSTQLKRVEQRSRQAAHVLELLYGDLGQRWAPNEMFGRIGALFHITAKGRTLLEDERKEKNCLDFADTLRIEVLVAVQRVQPKPDMRQALAFCQTQAKALEAKARAVWAEVQHFAPTRAA